MPHIYQFSETEIIAFVLVFLRISAFVLALPILGASNIPAPIKMLFSLALSFVLFPIVLVKGLPSGLLDEGMVFLAIKELMLGLFLGFLCRLFFMAVEIAGSIMSISMGLSAAQIYNPAMGTQGGVVEQFQITLAMLVFLSISGHHLFLGGIAESFTVLPLSFDGLKIEGVKNAALLGHEVLAIGIKISSPVLLSVFLTNLSMGIIGRAVPQINVLVTSLHLTVSVGILVMLVSVPLFVGEMYDLKDLLLSRVFEVMKSL